MSTKIEVFCDFDGTITAGDTIDILLEQLALPSWHDVEARWEAGEIGSRECMALQVPLIQGGWNAIHNVLETVVKVDPTFAPFAGWCKQNSIPLRVVSDGIDKVIKHILNREKIVVDTVWANHLVEGENNALSLEFPFAAPISECGSGLCKCKIVNNSNRPLRVVIGDGRSDFCWSAQADLVFAKSKLRKHCKDNGIHHVPFENFADISACLEGYLKEEIELRPTLAPKFV